MSDHTIVIKKACTFIDKHEQLPNLKDVAKHVGLSPTHFHRIFTKSLGITPRDYGDANRQNKFKQALHNGENITSALYAAGFGSSSRLYEFTHRYLGMTPKEYQQGGKKQTIWFTIVDCPLDLMLIATTEKGICFLGLGNNKNQMLKEFKREFPAAKLIEKEKKLRQWAQALINYLSGDKPWPILPYDIQATAFRRKVWDWLRTIPSGKTYTYSEVAKAIGQPRAARAVASACAKNPASLIIPCHRIVPKSGGIGGYRWKPSRKQKLLQLEKT